MRLSVPLDERQMARSPPPQEQDKNDNQIFIPESPPAPPPMSDPARLLDDGLDTTICVDHLHVDRQQKTVEMEYMNTKQKIRINLI